MSKLTLRQLNANDEEAFFDGLKEWDGDDLNWYTFSWQPGMAYSEMLSILDKEVKGIDLAPGRVPHTMLYGFVNGKIIGRVSVRHSLNENLRKRGGHIGYAVAPKFRKQGHATEMVQQALEYCQGFGLSKIMITRADGNVPSWKIIENFGGVLEDKIWDDVDDEMIRRYWLDLKA